MKTEILQSTGVSKKASQVYLAALSLGIASVQKMARAAKLKRSSVYEYIDELLEAQLLEKVPRGKRVYYRAVSPEQIEKQLQSQLKAFQDNLPDLLALHSKSSAKPKIQILEGRAGVRQIYTECTDVPFVRAYSYLPDIEKLFYNEVQDIGTRMLEKEVRVHELMPDRPESRRTARSFGAIVGNLYESRIIEGEVFNDMLIYGDVVAILRIHELDLFVVRLEDTTIATSMKTLFDAAWKTATPYWPKKGR